MAKAQLEGKKFRKHMRELAKIWRWLGDNDPRFTYRLVNIKAPRGY